MTRSPALALPLLCLVSWLGPVAALQAQPTSTRDGLLRLVPEDAAACLVVHDLRRHAPRLEETDWLKELAGSPLGQGLPGGAELGALAKLDQALLKQLGIGWKQFRDEVLGDALVLAYLPGPADKPASEQGLLLLHARDPGLLAKLLERINQEQLKSGEIKRIEARQHRQWTYQRRVEQAGEHFYHLNGPLLIFASHEPLLHEVLQRRVTTGPAGKANRVLHHLYRAGVEGALATLWVNPRALDAELRRQLEQAAGADAPHVKQFLSYWQALEGLSLSLHLEGPPTVRLALHARTPALPETARKLVKEAAQPSELWRKFPQDSLLTAACCTNPALLLETLEQVFGPDVARELADTFQGGMGLNLGSEVLKKLLPNLGPNCGFCVTAPTGNAGVPQLLVALQVGARQPGKDQDRALLKALHFVVGLGVQEHNRKHKDHPLRLLSETQGKVEVFYLEGGKLAPGLRPAFAAKDGYLLLASAPEVIHRFGADDAPPPAGDTPLLRYSAARVARLLQERPDALPRWLLPLFDLTRPQPDGNQGGQRSRLLRLDEVGLVQRTEGDDVVWVLSLRLETPKK